MTELFMSAASSPSSEAVYVATRLMGGLGNQLFQYAAGRALASRLNARLILDCTPMRRETVRRYALDRYAIDAEVVWNGARKIPRWKLRLPGQAGRRVADAIQSRLPLHTRINGRRFKVLLQQGDGYDPRFETLTGSVCLYGTWQSYRYFEDAAETIRAEIRLSSEPMGANRIWLDRIRQSNSVCLHVRRGDYLVPHPIGHTTVYAPVSYYYRAVHIVRERLENPQFYVFSDDWPWCRENLTIEGAVLVDANGPEAVVEELRLMAACRHHIIANSSLSWWAAWLAKHPEQVVIAPQPWVHGRRWAGLAAQGMGSVVDDLKGMES